MRESSDKTMTGFIYLIQNDINGKQYVGQTAQSIEERFSKHIKTANSGDGFALHQAIRKYRVQHFSIKLIEEVDFNKLDEREQYWIKHYDTYLNGYNETIGGEGNHKYDYSDIYNYYINHNRCAIETAQHFNCDITTVLSARRANGDNPADWYVSKQDEEKIVQLSDSGYSISSIAQITGYHTDTISKKLQRHGIDKHRYQREQQAKKIIGISCYSGKEVKFSSIREAARWLGNINYSQNIGACLHKRQKTAYGYEWFYQEENKE